jgi:hypothetical protein
MFLAIGLNYLVKRINRTSSDELTICIQVKDISQLIPWYQFLTGRYVIWPKWNIHVDTPYSSMTIPQYIIVCVHDIPNPKNIVQPMIRIMSFLNPYILKDRYKHTDLGPKSDFLSLTLSRPCQGVPWKTDRRTQLEYIFRIQSLTPKWQNIIAPSTVYPNKENAQNCPTSVIPPMDVPLSSFILKVYCWMLRWVIENQAVPEVRTCNIIKQTGSVTILSEVDIRLLELWNP